MVLLGCAPLRSILIRRHLEADELFAGACEDVGKRSAGTIGILVKLPFVNIVPDLEIGGSAIVIDKK